MGTQHLTGFKALSSFANNKMDPRLFRNLDNILTGIQDRYDTDGLNESLEKFRKHVLRADNPHDVKIDFNYTTFLNTLYTEYTKYNPNTGFTKTSFIKQGRTQRMFVLEVIRRIALLTYVTQPMKTPDTTPRFPNTPTPVFHASIWTPPSHKDKTSGLYGITPAEPINLNANTFIIRTSIKNAQNTTENICTFLNTKNGDMLTLEHDASNNLLKTKRNGNLVAQVPTQPKTTVAFRWTQTHMDTLVQTGTSVFALQHADTHKTLEFDQLILHMPVVRKSRTSTIRQISLYPGYLLETQTLSIMDTLDTP